MTFAIVRSGFVLAIALTVGTGVALAEKKYGPGATDTEIKIGQTMPYSGPASLYSTVGKAMVAYFDKMNAEGGVNGRKIKLISLDDGYSPPKAVEQTRKLVEQEEVLLIFGTLGNAVNMISANFFKDPTDLHWNNDVATKEWLAWMKRYYPDGNAADVYNVYGYSYSQVLVEILKRCGDDLTRENVMKQATNLKNIELPMLLPGIKITTSPTDYRIIKQLQLMRFDGKQWVLFGDVMGD
jgi:substrate-binding family protein